jgi:hypothetical protein
VMTQAHSFMVPPKAHQRCQLVALGQDDDGD